MKISSSRKEKKCIICGKDFVTYHPKTSTCSTVCSTKRRLTDSSHIKKAKNLNMCLKEYERYKTTNNN